MLQSGIQIYMAQSTFETFIVVITCNFARIKYLYQRYINLLLLLYSQYTESKKKEKINGTEKKNQQTLLIQIVWVLFGKNIAMQIQNSWEKEKKNIF